MKANNLGGVGPGDDSDEVLRYSEVTEKDGRPVDLVVSVQDGHEYEVADNYAVRSLAPTFVHKPTHPRRTIKASGRCSAR